MGKYKIADLNVLIENGGTKTEQRGKKYLYDYDGEPDIKLRQNKENFPKWYKSHLEKRGYSEKKFSIDDYIHGLYNTGFSYKILEHNGCVLHSSAIAVDGNAYLFSAHSGTGKSTHTSLWLENFKDRAEIINDDKPAIREIDGEFYVYGTPWSGKSNLNLNKKVKLKGITFIEQSKENWIEEISNEEALTMLLSRSFRHKQKENMSKLLKVFDSLLKSNVKIYKMGCNISNDAAYISYNKMSQEEFICV